MALVPNAMGIRPTRGVKVDGKTAPQLTLLKSVSYAQNVERRYFIIFITMVRRKLCAPKSIQTERSTSGKRKQPRRWCRHHWTEARITVGEWRYFVFVIRQWIMPVDGRWLCYHCRIWTGGMNSAANHGCQLKTNGAIRSNVSETRRFQIRKSSSFSHVGQNQWRLVRFT